MGILISFRNQLQAGPSLSRIAGGEMEGQRKRGIEIGSIGVFHPSRPGPER
jgi:hypothetical protein